MSKPRRPAGLWIITLAGIILGTWLGMGGLFMRIFGEAAAQDPLPFIAALSFGPELLNWLSTSTQGWLRLVTGCALYGAVMGLWLRQSWAMRSTQLLAVISLTFLGAALAAAPLILICLSLPSTVDWLRPPLEAEASRVPA